MSSPRLIADRKELGALFDELAEELGQMGASADVVMVGGSWLLWHSRRAATRDVDSARRLDPEIEGAVQRVASRHDLADDWLNDRAAGFWPANALVDECAVIYERGPLVVRTPKAEVIFVMKLYRASPQDYEDMINLWPSCGFADCDAAAAAYQAAFPHAPSDPYIVGYIAQIAREATSG